MSFCMNRKILVLVCVGVAAGLVLVRVQRPGPKPAVPPATAAIQPSTEIPIAPPDSDSPISPAVPAQTESDSTMTPAVETAAADVVPSRPPSETSDEDKYELLRALRAWAAQDPEGALASA